MEKVDLKILRELQEDGRLSNQKLATKLNTSTTASWRRVRALEEQGVIEGYTALLSRNKLGLNLCSFVHVNLERHISANRENFENHIIKCPEVTECYACTGDVDFILKVVTSDITSLDRFLHEVLFKLPEVAHVRSNIAIKESKYTSHLPLQNLD